MKKHRGSKKSHHLKLHLHSAPPHCESQIALRNDEDDDNSSNSDSPYIGHSASHYNNALRHNLSQMSFESDTGINLKIMNSR